MNRRSTWNWIIVAVALCAFIYFERQMRKPEAGPGRILDLRPAAITSIQVRPAGQLEIRADRTNGVWVLTRPTDYPAQATAIESLLSALEKLTPAIYISARELRERHKSDTDYGFDSPQASLNIQQGDARMQILIGSHTAPGDALYVQVVGVEGVGVVSAELLKLIPKSADDWRDTAFAVLRPGTFDRISIANGSKAVELQLDPRSKRWMMKQPLRARADNTRIFELLQQLDVMRVTQFVTDNPKSDLESFGLQPAELELSFSQGTNNVVLLQFGKSTTNGNAQVFARRSGVNSIVTVSRDMVAPWRAAVKDVNELRDRLLVSSESAVEQIEVRGENPFVLRRSTNSWKLEPESFPVDAGLVNDFIAGLATMQIVQFKADAVTGPDLPAYGLANPLRHILLTMAGTNVTDAAASNTVELSFGTIEDKKIFVRRSDEDSVYAVAQGDFESLPTAPWKLRERQLWEFSENDVARLTIQQEGRVRELIRNGTNSWSFAPGSQGDINVFAVEETVHRLGTLAATAWIARGVENRAKYGFSTNELSLTFELKNGEKNAVELGGMSETQYPAAVMLDGQTWIFQFPVVEYQYVSSYLTIPRGTP